MSNRRRPRPQRQSWAELKAQHRNTRVSVRIPWDSESADEAARLAEILPRVQEEDERENRAPKAPALARRITELEAKARESEVVFTFEGVGRRRYQLLLEEHKTEDGETPFDPETFPPALMAASCVEPAELRDNIREWTEIHDEWSTGQVTRLWGAVLSANAGVTEAPKSLLASVILETSDSEQN